MSPELLDALSFHADELNRGQDLTDSLATRYALIAPEFVAFFYLARQLHGTMVPLTPPAVFTRRLRQELLGQQSAKRITLVLPRSLWMVGSLLSMAGLTFLLRRHFRRSAMAGNP